MNVYLLDWNGTLDQLRDPHGFIRALQHMGHKVVIYTGNLRLQEKAALAADLIITKGESLGVVQTDIMTEWPDTQTIIWADDKRIETKIMIEDMTTRPGGHPDWEYLDPHDMIRHLSGLAEDKL